MPRSMDLAWIVVNDFNKAVKFYTEVVGLKLMRANEEMGWAELKGETGAVLGISKQWDPTGAQMEKKGCGKVQPGQNAIPCFTVKSLSESKTQMEKDGAVPLGEICEVPGHVVMQLYRDLDGNQFHVVQKLDQTA